MILLALDTSTPSGGAAIFEDERLIAEVNHDSEETFSERLLPAVRFLLQAGRINLRDVEGFAVAVGPGSFTGIRIGLSAVKSFAFASGRPVAPVSSLAALAWKLKEERGRLICPMIDAKKGEVYAALFESTGKGFREVVPQGAYAPDSLFSRLPSHRVIRFIGSGARLHRSAVLRYLKDKARFPRRSTFIAHEVGVIGGRMLREGRGKDAREVEPLYLRRSQAEEHD